MFMSLFSHFEIAQAQKWRFSLSPVKGTNSKPNAEATSSSAESKTAGKDKNPSQPGGPRFAPELDGLHCFESIVPFLYTSKVASSLDLSPGLKDRLA
ncbi:hypothetical protein D0Y65_010555 [Glycine soja]|uniref:Uncharacterized protein n=1 Tax=Glycine soja TaxID=3848 RepID=A0A445L419_GLYSO|nr:hypothetical protein D0Y65_010555 [Glycine soja]